MSITTAASCVAWGPWLDAPGPSSAEGLRCASSRPRRAISSHETPARAASSEVSSRERRWWSARTAGATSSTLLAGSASHRSSPRATASSPPAGPHPPIGRDACEREARSHPGQASPLLAETPPPCRELSPMLDRRHPRLEEVGPERHDGTSRGEIEGRQLGCAKEREPRRPEWTGVERLQDQAILGARPQRAQEFSLQRPRAPRLEPREEPDSTGPLRNCGRQRLRQLVLASVPREGRELSSV